MRHADLLKPLAAAVLLVAAGCGTVPSSGPAPVVTDGRPVEEAATPPAKPPTTPAATQPITPAPGAAFAELLARADSARGQGEYDQALALLERAQRIEPGSARIYLDLAVTHRARGDLEQARATAERGMLYCSRKSECDALRSIAR